MSVVEVNAGTCERSCYAKDSANAVSELAWGNGVVKQ